MKIPSKVKIGAYQLDIKYANDANILGDENVFGTFNFEEGVIYIKLGLMQEQSEQTFLHEVLELAIRNICKIFEEDFSHKDFSRTIQMLYYILKDNKLNFGE